MLNSSEFFYNLFIVYISEYFLSVFQKLIQNFPISFKILLNFYAISPQLPQRPFKNFFKLITRNYPVISQKLLRKSLKFYTDFLITFTKLFQNVPRIFLKFLKNYFTKFLRIHL